MKKINKLRRLWAKSPRLAIAAALRLRKKRKSKKTVPGDWNKNWLGEEMRPFNSLGT